LAEIGASFRHAVFCKLTHDEQCLSTWLGN